MVSIFRIVVLSLLIVLVLFFVYKDSCSTPGKVLDGQVMWVLPDSIEADTSSEEVYYGDTENAEITILVEKDDGKFKLGQQVKIIRYE